MAKKSPTVSGDFPDLGVSERFVSSISATSSILTHGLLPRIVGIAKGMF